ncbi:hypothetical protein EJ03DRAFT_355054 [Teratosphaeria nubilosa]|uniref:Uncharacterized protein n=1 Tax=Teratosphaeria nubilosa TaxID=161662 RepID=A0A6G1KXW7_9PEZI|nr:hypothetical protein EJ03DRAFT_355054 [Teratosphaeria nubilosa]
MELYTLVGELQDEISANLITNCLVDCLRENEELRIDDLAEAINAAYEFTEESSAARKIMTCLAASEVDYDELILRGCLSVLPHANEILWDLALHYCHLFDQGKARRTFQQYDAKEFHITERYWLGGRSADAHA